MWVYISLTYFIVHGLAETSKGRLRKVIERFVGCSHLGDTFSRRVIMLAEINPAYIKMNKRLQIIFVPMPVL